MVTVGFDFGTHQTKICCETVESGTTFYEVLKFDNPNGGVELTLPSIVRLRDDGTLRYGYEALADDSGGRSITYFKQKMFSQSAVEVVRSDAMRWAVLYIAFVIFKLDEYFKGPMYVIHMGMPTDADRGHYEFCKRQALKVMASAMLMARSAFRGNLNAFVGAQHQQLVELVDKCLKCVPEDFREIQRRFPVVVFPEAYAALIPLINDSKLPEIGPNLFVDIGGGTVDISFFTNQIDGTVGKNRPCLYYFHSVPYGLNMITGQDLDRSHDTKVGTSQITFGGVNQFRENLTRAVDEMMVRLEEEYYRLGKTSLMPFRNLCSQMLNNRPICYSGGGSMFASLRLQIADSDRYGYKFTDVKTVSGLIDHSKLHVNDEMFHVLATAFSLSHYSLRSSAGNEGPDSIVLVSVGNLFTGMHLPDLPTVRLFAPDVTRYGMGGLIRYDYTTDIQRAENGDLEAKRRIELAWETGDIPLGIIIAPELLNRRLRELEEEKEKEMESDRIVRRNRIRFENMMKQQELFAQERVGRINEAKAAFSAGDCFAAISVATLILEIPDLTNSQFEEARDWLNIARDKGITSMKLLEKFVRVCQKGRIHEAVTHLRRYERIINDCRNGYYSELTFRD